MSRPKRQQQRRRAWQPLERASVPRSAYDDAGRRPADRAFRNDLYSVFVWDMEHDTMHVSFHRHNRAAVRDWRHFQAIKNEVAGAERLAVEVFPPESQLIDAANEYHLWVWPRDIAFPFMLVASDQDANCMTQAEGEAAYGKSQARQRDWQPGIPTGLGAA